MDTIKDQLSFYASSLQLRGRRNNILASNIANAATPNYKARDISFEDEIKKRKIKPTKMLPLWDLLGVGLGFGSTILGKKAAMLCTA